MGKVSEIMLLKQPEQSALAVEVQTDMNGMSEAIGKNFVKIDSLFKEQGEVTTDIPYVEYPNFESLTEQNIRMIIGLKSTRELQGEGDIRSITIPEKKIVSCLHRGTYKELAALYNEMMEWIKNNGYKPSGTSIEYYYSNPNVPEEEQVTRIVHNQLAALHQAVNIITMTNAHCIFSLILCRGGQVLFRGNFQVGVIALRQVHRQARQFKQAAVIGHQVDFFPLHSFQSLPVQVPAEALGRLHRKQSGAVRCLHHSAVIGDLDGILDRNRRGSGPHGRGFR